MTPLIETRRKEIAALCRLHHVRRLDVFGSGAEGLFDSETSDFDFLVEFKTLDPVPYKNAFFGLLAGLEALFKRPVDLVTVRSMRNPYFIQAVEESRRSIYAA